MALCKPTGNIEFVLVSNSARIKDYQFAHYPFCPNMYNVDQNENSDKSDVTSLMRGIQRKHRIRNIIADPRGIGSLLTKESFRLPSSSVIIYQVVRCAVEDKRTSISSYPTLVKEMVNIELYDCDLQKNLENE
ncbi:hypothetical protein OIU84_016435 [Salix udensis]|uniref:Uncharacterized protein n=1 Tax=Salix udensis TaxID=889485 RepID=A0AAD6NQR9_9ROSI|nr:hypothetical protein OIU84_016435 [Salix udensis]